MYKEGALPTFWVAYSRIKVLCKHFGWFGKIKLFWHWKWLFWLCLF